MKMPLVIFWATMIPMTCFAADLALKDGRVLKDAAVVSQSPRKVTIKHANGLSAVAKDLLPPELQSQYPIDEAAAQEADRKAVIAAEGAQKFHKAEAERAARVREQREKTAAENEAITKKESAEQTRLTQSARANATSLATAYFENQYERSPTGENICSVSLSDIRPVEGWAGRWLVTGRATIRHYNNGFVYSDDTQVGDPDFRRQYNNSQPNPAPIRSRDCDLPRHWNDVRNTAKDEHKDHTTPPRTDQRPQNFDPRTHYYGDRTKCTYTSEIREFEGYYSTEGTTPTIDITLR